MFLEEGFADGGFVFDAVGDGDGVEHGEAAGLFNEEAEADFFEAGFELVVSVPVTLMGVLEAFVFDDA